MISKRYRLISAAGTGFRGVKSLDGGRCPTYIVAAARHYAMEPLIMLDSPIQRLIPKADDLLRMSVEQLAPILLKLAYEVRQSAGFIPRTVCDITVNDGYPGWKKGDVDTHLTRVWNWIERRGLIEPSPGFNGHNGWRMLSEEGEGIAKGADLEATRAMQELPRALLHDAHRHQMRRFALVAALHPSSRDEL